MIYKKLLEIQKHVKAIGKDAKSFSYTYVSGSKVLDAIKPLMNDLGLILKQEVIELENTPITYKTKNGEKTEVLSKAKMIFTWVDAETGESDINVFYANGFNDFEKGLGSALTYAERYFLLKFFHIPTDEDDIDNPTRKQIKNEAVAPPAPPTPQPISPSKPKLKYLNTLLVKTGTDRDAFRKYFKVESVNDLNMAQLEKGLEILKKKLKEQEAEAEKQKEGE